jgi:uncharacterized membrane protein YphA (DoxX/SURF4 family)
MDGANPSVEEAFVLVVRLFLGGLFLSSALGKLANWRGFVQGTLDYRLLPERAARTFAALLPWLELALAGALILGVALSVAGLAASLLLICFTIAVIVNLRRGREVACSCYGIVGTKTIGWGTVARNLLLLLPAALLAGLASSAAELDQWLALWRADMAVFSSPGSLILLLLLAAFCFVSIQLVEWAVDIAVRGARLTARIGR